MIRRGSTPCQHLEWQASLDYLDGSTEAIGLGEEAVFGETAFEHPQPIVLLQNPDVAQRIAVDDHPQRRAGHGPVGRPRDHCSGVARKLFKNSMISACSPDDRAKKASR